MADKMNEIAFGGEIQPTECECHAGKFLVVVFQHHPVLGRRLFASKMFDTEAEATSKLESTVFEAARELLDAAGLKIDDAREVRIARGEDDTDREMKKYRQRFRERNQDLH